MKKRVGIVLTVVGGLTVILGIAGAFYGVGLGALANPLSGVEGAIGYARAEFYLLGSVEMILVGVVGLLTGLCFVAE